MKSRAIVCAVLLMTFQGIAGAADPVGCRAPQFAEVGWTDITLTTSLTTAVLEGLGYAPKVITLSTGIAYKAMEGKSIDVFLGTWDPALIEAAQPYYNNKSIQTVRVNLTGAKFTLAVPRYVYEQGVKSYADLDTYKSKFGGKIYGVEPGGNKPIQNLIADNAYNLGSWSLVESSEKGMLTQVGRQIRKNDWIVFLGWAPHPMNKNIELEYLSGGDKYYGENFGASSVRTDVRTGYLDECPNVGQLLKNLEFSIDAENTMMDYVINGGLDPRSAVKKWLSAHPEWLDRTLLDVQSLEGQPGLAAVKSYMDAASR
ncbi:choline ABC transporter substrate-binding protein [Pseudomonas sp. GM55]|uniref:choline ABC transporter substrate-binding protein n=1 Tax=Pseudomonas sp. GM55 TaxID=1144333 RepID=UPI000270678D|nr:choline ABC transporter substrate-binding protein [Pseudomonas sp. GM55]EJM72770.1 choline ABC transporter, periplasmic binding protein [Pseudomonas sp. GM55]